MPEESVATRPGRDVPDSHQTPSRPELAIPEQKRPNAHAPAAVHTRMFVTYALALRRPASFRGQEQNDRNDIQKALAKQLDAAFAQREQLPLYDRLLLALALRNHSSAAIVQPQSSTKF